MFAVGRYDPRAEDAAAAAAAKRTKQAKKKRKTTRSKEPPSTPTDVVERQQPLTLIDEGGGEEAMTNNRARPSRKERDGNGSDSSSMPYSSGDSDDSSSMPYSSGDDGDASSGDEEDANANSKDKEKSSLRVIAPEQKFPAVGVKLRRASMTDEGLDDFDVEEDRQAKTYEGAAPLTDQQRLHNAEISTALQLSRLPIRDAAKVWNLPSFLVSNLERDGYENFFPIQSLVIPDVIASERHSQIRVRDICVSAPTGSGKSLAFVLPVLNALSSTTVRRLRALVVLPSRDLATQVYKVFKRYSEGSQLQVGLAIGQTDFEAEQKALILGSTSYKSHAVADAREDDDFVVLRHAFNPTNPKFAVEAFARSPGYFLEQQCPEGLGNGISSALSTPLGGRSAVDILVATPGRLIDHLDKTPGFTLQHLRFLVIDEADRLLNQSYQGWIHRVTTAATSSNTIRHPTNPTDQATVRNGVSLALDPITWRKSMTNDRSTSIAASVSRPVPLRKMLFSATLTRDPQKLASLGLVNPKHFDAHHLNVKAGMEARGGGMGMDRHVHASTQRYSVPPSLSEHKLVCTAEQKPLVLMALLLQHISEARQIKNGLGNMVVVFTSSLDSTHRLARLLQLLWSAAGYGPATAIAEFSSALSQKQRSKLMRRCAVPLDSSGEDQNRVSVIICSDGMSRGMDLPNVGAVINYDVPRYAKTYVHRCGRTARAGKKGRAISVLKGGQVGQFFKMRKLIDDPSRVEEMKLKKELVGGAIGVYQACMKALRGVIDAEESGDLEAAAPLTDEWVPRVKCAKPASSDSAASSRSRSSGSDISSEEEDAIEQGEQG